MKDAIVLLMQGLETIDLLKIDVERAEMAVLRGVSDEHWQRIRQVVMEVHDVDGSLDIVLRLLKTRAGFTNCVVEQDKQLKGSTLYNIYARS